MRCSAIGSRDIVAFAQALREKVQPQTVGNYLSHLASMFAIARPAWGYDLDQQAMADAIKVAKRLGLTSKSRERSRRPTIDELDLLMGHFATVRVRRRGSNPMEAIIGFAIFSTRRLVAGHRGDASAARRRNLSLHGGRHFRVIHARLQVAGHSKLAFSRFATRWRLAAVRTRQNNPTGRSGERTSIVAIDEALYAFTPNWR